MPTADEIRLEEIRLEHATRRAEISAGVRKVVYGTAVVGVAVAFFPFAQQFAQSVFAERIEKVKTEAEFEVLQEENRLKQLLEKQKSDLEKLVAEAQRVGDERNYLEGLASEARSESLERRIIIAEFFSFLASDQDRREHWTSFRDHLYGVQRSLNEEREVLISTTTEETTSQAEKDAAISRLEQIQRQENPGQANGFTDRLINKIVLVATQDSPLEVLRRAARDQRGWSDVGEHFIIRLDGSVDIGRPLDRTPAVALGSNTGAVGIGIACDTRTVFAQDGTCRTTPEQYEELVDLVRDLLREYRLSPDRLLGFQELRQGIRYDFLGDLVKRVRRDLYSQ